MKFNFKKISAIGTSILLTGMTLGVAAAASFPSPYSSTTSSGVAVVTGTGSGVDDSVAANSINTYLATKVQTSGGIPTGGESYKFEKTSTKFHLGDRVTDVVSGTIDDDELPNLLKSGVFVDDDNDEFDYDQKIVFTTGTSPQLVMFEDSDYAEDEPTIGLKINSGTTVLTYTLDFTDEPYIAETVTADLVMMGKTYYVLSNSSSGVNKILTLLDSAQDTIVAEGETVTVNVEGTSYSIYIDYVGSTPEVKLNVNGESTNTLEEGETQKLSDGSYVGVKDIMYDSKDTGISKIEFSIGSGKLKLTSGSDLEVNDDTVSGLGVTIVNDSTGNKLSEIQIAWADDDEELFITETTDITMPSFESIKMSFGGINYPVEETIEVKGGDETHAVLENFPLKDSVEDIPILYGATGAFTGIGKASDDQVKTAYGTGNTNVTWNKSAGDDYFVVSWSDGNDGESYLVRSTNFDNTNSQVDFKYRNSGVWTDLKTNREITDSFDVGSAGAQITLHELGTGANNQYVIVGNASTTTDFHTLYSKEGMKVYLPYIDDTTPGSAEGDISFTNASGGFGHNATSFYLVMKEEDKDENIADGDWLNITLDWNSDNEVETGSIATSNADATSKEIGDTDVWRDFTYSDLATEILYDKPTSGQKSIKLIYHGKEVTADVYITAPSAIMAGGEVGNMVFTDAEKTSWQGRNVILVGGSCINSATAEALGLSANTCETAFTASTGVGDGQYLIQSVGNAFTSGKIALVVAGYNKADTAAAASRLVNQPETIDTTSGNKYIGVVGVSGSSTISKVA